MLIVTLGTTVISFPLVKKTAIICGSASTFRVFFKTYLPRLWGSYALPSGNSKSHPYAHFHSGNFALNTFGQSQSSRRDRKKTMDNDLAELDSNSEEGIIPKNNTSRTGTGGRGVVMKSE